MKDIGSTGLVGPAGFSLEMTSSRRTILKWSGVAAIVATVGSVGGGIAGRAFAQQAVDLGTGDIGVLNYAYALEQLEAAYYEFVVANFYGDISDDEARILRDIRDHEVAHREFLREALGSGAIPDLEVDFSAVDFTTRQSVLETARTFEDLGVSAYNGAGKLIENPDYLLAAGRIVSVEARHAAVIRDLLQPLTVAFAGPDVVDDNGLDVVREPGEVLALADPFIVTPVTANAFH